MEDVRVFSAMWTKNNRQNRTKTHLLDTVSTKRGVATPMLLFI